MRLLIYSFLILATAGSKNFLYFGNTPRVFLYLDDMGDSTYVSILDIEIADTFFIGKECRINRTCTSSANGDSFDPTKHKHTPIEEEESKILYHDVILTAKKFMGYLETTLAGHDRNATLNVVTSASQALDISGVGVLGLKVVPNYQESLIMKIFKEAEEHKTLIIRRGPIEQTLRDRKMSGHNIQGNISTGAARHLGCGDFRYIPTIPNEGWKIKANIQIGKDIYTDQAIGFSIDKTTTVPQKIFDKHFKDITNADKLPSLSLKYESFDFSVNSTAFQNFYGTGQRQLQVLVNTNKKDEFVLGDNFLGSYCIALKADDNSLTKFSVGLANFIELPSDPTAEFFPNDHSNDGILKYFIVGISTTALAFVVICAGFVGYKKCRK